MRNHKMITNGDLVSMLLFVASASAIAAVIVEIVGSAWGSK